MRKLLSILLLVLLTCGIHSCKEPEATNTYKTEDLVGVWELSWTKVYDREAKFLEEIDAQDEYGCGYMTWTYSTDKIAILNYIGKGEGGNCLEEITSLNYTLQKGTIHTLDDLGIAQEMLITSLTTEELVVMTTLSKPMEDKANAIKYAELRYRRVN